MCWTYIQVISVYVRLESDRDVYSHLPSLRRADDIDGLAREDEELSN